MFFRADPFRALWNEIGRMSDDFQRTMTRVAHSTGVLVWSDEQNVYVEADLPGVDAKQIDVTLDEGKTLTIACTRELPNTDKAVWIRQERPHGEWTRSVELPVLVNAEQVTSSYEHGVLKLTLPKSEAAKPRKIAIS